MTESSKLRERYGVSKAPIAADRAFKKPLEHFKKMGVEAYAWILLNTDAGTRVNINTYNGNAGKNSKPKTFDIPEDTKAFNKMVKGYDEVPVDQCPITEASAEAVTSVPVPDADPDTADPVEPVPADETAADDAE